MELIKEIYAADIGLAPQVGKVLYDIRKAARAVVFNSSDQIALLYVSKNNYHKLPGGGIEGQELVLEALEREIDEEVGAKVKVTGEIGVIIEYRNYFNLLQISYCYIAQVTEKLTKPKFTSEEISNGFELKWLSIAEAISVIKNDQPSDTVGKFIQHRDLGFLLQTQRIISNGFLLGKK